MNDIANKEQSCSVHPKELIPGTQYLIGSVSNPQTRIMSPKLHDLVLTCDPLQASRVQGSLFLL